MLLQFQRKEIDGFVKDGGEICEIREGVVFEIVIFAAEIKRKILLFNYKRSNKSVSFESKRRKRRFKTVEP